MSDGPSRSHRPTEDRREAEDQASGPTIRDRRRIDPQTGQVRPTQDAASAGPGPAPVTDAEVGARSQAARSEAKAAQAQAAQAPAAQAPAADAGAGQPTAADSRVAELEQALADRTSDLQRLQAEYVNYKRRIDRDRDVARLGGVETVLRELLTVLDNIGAAREHEELSAGFRAVADDVERVAAKNGLESFGKAGDPFDPHVHEALMHSHATEVDGVPITGPTCVAILQPGYKIKDKIVRPARVAVAEPGAESAAATSSEPAGVSDGE